MIEETSTKQIFGGIDDIAKQLAQEVLLSLSEVLDDAQTQQHQFRGALASTAARVMRHINLSPERIGIYEEALPGFTLMVVKKDDGPIEASERDTPFEVKETEDYAAAGLLIEQFMKKTQQRIISIEHSAVLLVLFPVSDTRKHLKVLGFAQ
jgi:hypothetical protein